MKFARLFVAILLAAALFMLPLGSVRAVVQGITPCLTTPAGMTAAVTSAARTLSGCGTTLILINNGLVDAYFKLDTDSAVVATTSDNLLPAKSFVVLSVPGPGVTSYVALVTGSSTSAISFILGMSQT